MFASGREFFAQDRAAIGIEFSLARFDDSALPSSELDISVMPKIRLKFGKYFFAATGLGVGHNELRAHDSRQTRLRLGSDLFFAVDANVGYEFHWGQRPMFVEYMYTHRSNGGLASENQSLNVNMISIGTWF